MTSYLYRAPSGVAGDVTRVNDTVVVQGLLDSAKVPAAFGLPVKIVAGKVTKIEAGDTAADFYGVICRIAPAISGSTDETYNGGVPNADAINSIAVRGFVNVLCKIGTPAEAGAVYMRVVADTGKAVGDLEATSDVAAAGVAGGGNTGNGTIGTVSATQSAEAGAHTVTMLTATTFKVSTPSGIRLKDGATGSAYTAGGVTFTITVGGTPMVAGDSFTVTVTKNNVLLPDVIWASGGVDADKNAEIRIK